MLTSSSSSRSQSGFTGDSASLSATVDLEIVEEIFHRGGSATSFPQIFRPYTEVLQEHGISPTGDTAYYNFLLKVGVVKASTWGGKWSIWKATHHPYSSQDAAANIDIHSDYGNAKTHSNSLFSPPTARIRYNDYDRHLENGISSYPDFQQHAIQPDSQSRSYHSSLAEVKSRVPFLASASSDSDEGFADESARIRDEVQSEIAAYARPSPRKEMSKNRKERHHDGRLGSRSLVGYTPDHSFENDNDNDQEADLSSFMPPVRTSTPIFAQTPAYQKAYDESTSKYGEGRHLQPPAYSVSEVSQALEQTTEDLSALGLLTPTGKSVQLPNVNGPNPAAISELATWVDRIDDLPESARKRMVARADEFYEIGLMGRCWDMWFKTSEFYRVTYKNIPIARNNLLLRQVLEKWARVTQYQLSLPNTADKHRSYHLKSLVLKRWITKLKEKRLNVIERRWIEQADQKQAGAIMLKWKEKTERRRTERWKVDMAEREIRFTERRNQRAVRETMLYWRVEARARLLFADTRQKQPGEAFYEWHDAVNRQRQLRTRLQSLERKKLGEAFAVWRRLAVHAPREKQLIQRQEMGLVKRVWDDWRISSWQNKQSSTFDRRRLLLMGLDGWRARYRQAKISQRKAKIFDSTRLIDTTFKRWKIESWGRLLLQTKEKRLRERVWGRWKGGMARLENLEALGDKFIVQSSANKLHTLFSHWRSIAASHQTSHLRARLIHEQNLKSSALTKWRNSTSIIRGHVVMADKAHAFFLLRTAFKAWRGESAKLKAQRWVEERQHQLVKRVFDVWKNLAVRYQDLNSREVLLKESTNKRQLGQLLNRWTERVIEVKDREIRVARASDERLTKNALSQWRARLAVIQANQKKANDSSEIRESENLRRVLRFWRGRTKRQKRLRAMVDASIVESERRLVREVFGKWYELKRERELEDIENEVAFLHENVILYGVMDRWKAATEILPGIMADSTRLKRRTMGVWFSAMERKRKGAQLQQERDLKVLSEVFAQWREAAIHRSTLKARRIRNRSRPSLSATATAEASRLPTSRQVSNSSSNLASSSRRIPSTSTTSSVHAAPGERDRNRRTSGNGIGTGNGYRSRTPGLLDGEYSTLTDRLGQYQNQHQHPYHGRSDTVYSEPVYSRLRSELADKDQHHNHDQNHDHGRESDMERRRRYGSEELVDRAATAAAAGRNQNHDQRQGRRRRWSRDLGESNHPYTSTNHTMNAGQRQKFDKYPDHLGVGQARASQVGISSETAVHRASAGAGVRSGSEMLRALRGSMPGR
ncbi:hypothetical protein IAU59_007376 [Kwoniella sp. CBS 9459]